MAGVEGEGGRQLRGWQQPRGSVSWSGSVIVVVVIQVVATEHVQWCMEIHVTSTMKVRKINIY